MLTTTEVILTPPRPSPRKGGGGKTTDHRNWYDSGPSIRRSLVQIFRRPLAHLVVGQHFHLRRLEQLDSRARELVAVDVEALELAKARRLSQHARAVVGDPPVPQV